MLPGSACTCPLSSHSPNPEAGHSPGPLWLFTVNKLTIPCPQSTLSGKQGVEVGWEEGGSLREQAYTTGLAHLTSSVSHSYFLA